MSSPEDERPLLMLLSLATQLEREHLVAALSARGFEGVAVPEMRLLAELKENARSIQALADATGTTKQFCAREVRKLEAAGYVAMNASEDDRRVILVSLRPRGRRVLDAAREAKHGLDAGVARRLGEADLRTLRRLLARLIDEPSNNR